MSSKRTILITGCSDGSLGSHLALAFHQAGWRVLASARNSAKLTKAKEAGIETIQLDIQSDESIAAAVSQVTKLNNGTLDALLNNAGAGYPMPLMDVDIAKARELFELNVFPIIAMTRAFLPLLLDSKHGGMVINNTSGSSLPAGALPFAGAYNASKAAATALTETMRLELAPFGIKVVNMITGGVKSTFPQNAVKDVLPADSMYSPVKDVIEGIMAGSGMEQAADPVQWAQQVVKDLNKSSPPHWIFRGSYSWALRIASLLPVGLLDSVTKKISGLDVLETRIKEQGGPAKMKAGS